VFVNRASADYLYSGAVSTGDCILYKSVRFVHSTVARTPQLHATAIQQHHTVGMRATIMLILRHYTVKHVKHRCSVTQHCSQSSAFLHVHYTFYRQKQTLLQECTGALPTEDACSNSTHTSAAITWEDPLLPIFNIFLALWATLFLKFWRRRSAGLAYK
jgi:Calcium-activated chloride channel